jgi:hypothetical protein
LPSVKEFLKDSRITRELNELDYKFFRYLSILALAREPPYDAMNLSIEALHWFHARQMVRIGERFGLDVDQWRIGKDLPNFAKKQSALLRELPRQEELKVAKPYAITDQGYQFILERLNAISEDQDRRMEYQTMNLLLARNPLGIPKAANEIYLDSPNVKSIGRFEENDYSYPKDKAMSRRHARVIFREDEFWIEDLKSTNGTWKLDKKVPRGRRRIQIEQISDNDEFQLGNTVIRFLLKA